MDRRSFSKLTALGILGAATYQIPLSAAVEQTGPHINMYDLDGNDATHWLTELSTEFLSNQNDFIAAKVFPVV